MPFSRCERFWPLGLCFWLVVVLAHVPARVMAQKSERGTEQSQQPVAQPDADGVLRVGVAPATEGDEPPVGVPTGADADAELPAATDDEAAYFPASVAESGSEGGLVYYLERIEVRGNRTRPDVIIGYVPLTPGREFDPNDPALTQVRYRLMGTGFFNDVRLSLERGHRRGWAVLVITVKERNTLLIERVVAGLSRVVPNSVTAKDPARPYAGLGIEERNLLGLGIAVGAAAVASVNVGTGRLLQYGFDLRYYDPTFLGSSHGFGARFFHNHAREFFGRQTQVSNNDCPPELLFEEDDGQEFSCDPDIEGLRSVVIYDRTGVGFGTANDISSHLRYAIGWLGERIDVLNKPHAATTRRGDLREPIDFRIDDGVSTVSSVELGLTYDTRDHPAIPSRGQRLQLETRLASGFIGSDYRFARATAAYEHYFRLPWAHVLQLGAFAGVVFGRAPFFYRFYPADLTDLLPSRQLELNVDHRRAPNLLNTAIGEMDAEEVAGRIHAEYQLPLRRGRGVVRGIDAYFRLGMFLLARHQDLEVAIPGYKGLARLPVDLSFDLGVVADTNYGLFRVGFSSFVGFLPDLGRTYR